MGHENSVAEDGVQRGSVKHGTGEDGEEPDHILCFLQVLVGHNNGFGFYSKCNEATKEF